jgi:GMP synthase-like glutamine amidotransferase
MKAHVLQHLPFEGIGSMASWLSDKEADVGFTRFYESTFLPAVKGLDLVIAMGGPMSVNDEAAFPWLGKEMSFIHDAVRYGVPVVGVCLGAQLIASSLGARVYANREKEIGWFEIEATQGGEADFRFPKKATVFHWHGETFDLPDGATLLASSAACANQAFQVGERVIGLQFHLETTAESLDCIINNCRSELREGAFIQTEAAMRAVPDIIYSNINRLMKDILSYVTRIRS